MSFVTVKYYFCRIVFVYVHETVVYHKTHPLPFYSKMSFSSKKIYLYIIIALFRSPMESKLTCNHKYTNRPLDGYYCDGQKYRTTDKIGEAMCKQACFKSRECGAMSYNPMSDTCMLATQPCALAKRHDRYRLMIFRQQEQIECAVWVRDQPGVIPVRIVTPGTDAHVGRIAVGDEVLVGNGNLPGQNWQTYIAHKGRQVSYPNQDFLTTHSNCTMAWVPYTAGDVLPRNAIVTGMLANGRRLYSSLSWHAPISKWISGVYAEKDDAAYYAYAGSIAVRSFDILVSV